MLREKHPILGFDGRYNREKLPLYLIKINDYQ